MSVSTQAFSEVSMMAKRFFRARCSVKISSWGEATEAGFEGSVAVC